MEVATPSSEVRYCRLSDQVEQSASCRCRVYCLGLEYACTEVYLEEGKEVGEVIEGNVINPHTFSCDVQK